MSTSVAAWPMRGYWRNPEETSAVIDADGWFATGDVGYLDEDGYLYLVDRMKDLILRGGYSVYPREVEDVLHDHPAVQEAAVVGVPHETLGEEVVALVVPRPGAECEPDEVKALRPRAGRRVQVPAARRRGRAAPARADRGSS